MHRRLSIILTALAVQGCSNHPTGSQTSTDTAATSTTSPTTTDAPTCGDGQLDPGEDCDDGNTLSGDGCESDCTTTPGEDCGNGQLDPGEDCDDGNQIDIDACKNNCTLPMVSPTCGDGMPDPGEQCDDGNADNTDTCTSQCKNATCGDGFVQLGVEQCDEGDSTPSCDADCTLSGCGDGLVNGAAGEECEDGNTDDTDACLSTCKNASCGDGFVQTNVEECDDSTPDGDDLCNMCVVTPHRYIFVTEATFNGDFNGVAGADSNCLIAANAADIPDAGDFAWVAWLSMNTSQAAARLDTTFTGWYVLPTDPPTLVAKGWSGLTSGDLAHAIDRTEAGGAVPMPATVWTNTDGTGMLPTINMHCKNWNSSAGGDFGRVGLSSAVNGDWTDPATPASATCDTPHHLYCLQDLQ